MEIGTRAEDWDSFGTVGCRCREPLITAPCLERGKDKLGLPTHQAYQTVQANRDKELVSAAKLAVVVAIYAL